jgi:hypothetical protein
VDVATARPVVSRVNGNSVLRRRRTWPVGKTAVADAGHRDDALTVDTIALITGVSPE